MKKIIALFVLSVLMFSCQKEDSLIDAKKDLKIELREPMEKIDVCHYVAKTGDYHTININANAWPAHKAHGDKYGECMECNDCKFCDKLDFFNFDETDDFQNCEWSIDENNFGWYTQFLDTDTENSSYIGARRYLRNGVLKSQILVKYDDEFDLGWNDIPEEQADYCRAFIFSIANTVFDGAPPNSAPQGCSL